MSSEIPMPKVSHLEPDALDNKTVDSFPGMIVRKDLTSMMKRNLNVPTFVLEYLLGTECATDDEVLMAEGLAHIRQILTENYVHPDESETIKSRIRERGTYVVIDKLQANLNEYEDCYTATFTNLCIEPFVIDEQLVGDNPKILQGGIWCCAQIEYLHPADEVAVGFASVFDEKPRPRRKGGKRQPEDSPFRIARLKPIQMPALDLDGFIEARRAFSTREWIDLLLRSCGYEPTALSPKQKLHFIARMVPLAEQNYNLCELGPRGTGKSHLYKEISPYSILLSGGQTTTANLFGRMNAGRRAGVLARSGLVGIWDCVVFDEVAGMHFKDRNAIQMLKDYMASGSFSRGRDQLNAGASLVFEGNTNDTVSNILKLSHLFQPFPPEFNGDSAFFDRVHCYLPGWEIPKMREGLLTGHYGLITDCLAEFCRSMRRYDYTQLFDQYFRLNGDFNRRDEIGVRKTFSGLAKLLFPDGAIPKEDARGLLEYAIEGRRRVKEQLKTMAGFEFNDVDLGYSDVDCPSDAHVIYTPEQTDDTLVPASEQQPGHVYAIGRCPDGDCAVYRLENRAVTGNMSFRMQGLARSTPTKDAMQAAFTLFRERVDGMGWGSENKDYLLYYNDLQNKGASSEVSLAEFIGLVGAASGRPVISGLVIPGALRISGTIDPIVGLEDIIRVAKNAGARRILLPFGSSGDLRGISKSIEVVFYEGDDPVDAAQKALGA